MVNTSMKVCRATEITEVNALIETLIYAHTTGGKGESCMHEDKKYHRRTEISLQCIHEDIRLHIIEQKNNCKYNNEGIIV